jgi:hypothetical protein
MRHMNIQLILGEFSPSDALDLIASMINMKIKFHEGKISNESQEEDIKYRETRIKSLQRELYELKKMADSGNGNLTLKANIEVISK